MFLNRKEGLPSAPSYDEVMVFRNQIYPMADIENHLIHRIIFEGRFKDLPPEVQIIEPPYTGDDCQSWAFRRLGRSDYAERYYDITGYPLPGLQSTTSPSPGDLAVYVHRQIPIHFAIVLFDGRLISKWSSSGPVVIHPPEAYSSIIKPEYYSNISRFVPIKLVPL